MTRVTSHVPLVSMDQTVLTLVTATIMPAVTRWMETVNVNLVTAVPGARTRVLTDTLVTDAPPRVSVNLTTFCVTLYQAVFVNQDTLETIAVFQCQFMPLSHTQQIQVNIKIIALYVRIDLI